MGAVAGKIRGTVEINAIVHPPCTCGEPWSAHKGNLCVGYTPSRPSINHGTVFFHSKDRLANFLFKIERLIANMRLARMRRL